MGNQQTRDRDITHFEHSEKFRWTINNFSQLDAKKLCSRTFFIGGHPWQIVIFPKGDQTNNNLSIYLAAGNIVDLPNDWSRFANYKLFLINQVESQRTITKGAERKFNASVPGWGFRTSMTLSELQNSRGFIMNDTCIVEAVITVIRKVDFKSFGEIEEAFVPLLEEVCSWHPSLIECQRKRSPAYTEWAFTALGRVLHFLKTRKVKDMNEDASIRHLQLLWEELETCKFNLTWLEPHIQSALSMESYLEKFAQLETLKKKLAALDMETKLLIYLL